MVRNPVLEVMLLGNNEPTSYGEAMVGLDSKMSQRPYNPREDPCIKQSIDFEKNYLMVVRLLGADVFYPLWVRAYQPETFSHKRRSPKLLRNDNLGFSKP